MAFPRNRQLLEITSGCCILAVVTGGLLLLRESGNSRRLDELESSIRGVERDTGEDLSESTRRIGEILTELHARIAEIERKGHDDDLAIHGDRQTTTRLLDRLDQRIAQLHKRCVRLEQFAGLAPGRER